VSTTLPALIARKVGIALICKCDGSTVRDKRKGAADETLVLTWYFAAIAFWASTSTRRNLTCGFELASLA
jgi:hypothetical protein